MKPRVMRYLFAAALIAGVLTGSCLRVLYPLHGVWKNAVFLHGLGTLGGTFREVLLSTLLWGLVWLMFFAVIGLTTLAVPAVLALLLLHGMAFGAALTSLYRGHVLTGLVTAVGFVMPFAALCTGLLLLAAREAIRGGTLLSHQLRGREAETARARTYFLRFLVLSFGMLLLAVMQGFWIGKLYPAVLRVFAK